jgi:hypothetical protein
VSGVPDQDAGDPAGVLADVAEMIRTALSDYGEWRGPITPNAALDADLGMQSVEFSAVRAALVARWGAPADPDPLLRTLDLAGLASLTVADLADHVRAGLR